MRIPDLQLYTSRYADENRTRGGAPEPYEAGELTDTEYRMLLELSVNAGRVLGHEELLQRAGGIFWTRRLPFSGKVSALTAGAVLSAPSAYFLPSLPFPLIGEYQSGMKMMARSADRHRSA